MSVDRRNFLRVLSAGTAGVGAASLSAAARAAEYMPKSGRRVVVIGGGYGGTIAAKYVRMMDPSIEVVLVERNKQFVSCPFSNLVIGGERQISDITMSYDKLASNYQIKMVFDEVTSIDAEKKMVNTGSGSIKYDRLILSPGIDFRFEELEGYDPLTTPNVMPHAWKAGEQTLLLRKQIESMKDGGTVVMSIPLTPFRCPPGPYERASMISWYLKNHKPKSKVLILDANPNIASKGALFKKGWAKHYEGMIEYRGAQKVTVVNPGNMSVLVEGIDEVKGDVVNVIPPQRAGAIAVKTGLVGPDKNWCPINQTSFESTIIKDIHVIGDACSAGAMPKSGFSANTEAKVCATNVVALMNGRELVDLSSINTCYSFITPTEAVSVAAVYQLAEGKISSVPNSGGVSPDLSELEAIYGQSWFRNIRTEMSS